MQDTRLPKAAQGRASGRLAQQAARMPKQPNAEAAPAEEGVAPVDVGAAPAEEGVESVEMGASPAEEGVESAVDAEAAPAEGETTSAREEEEGSKRDTPLQSNNSIQESFRRAPSEVCKFSLSRCEEGFQVCLEGEAAPLALIKTGVSEDTPHARGLLQQMVSCFVNQLVESVVHESEV